MSLFSLKSFKGDRQRESARRSSKKDGKKNIERLLRHSMKGKMRRERSNSSETQVERINERYSDAKLPRLVHLDCFGIGKSNNAISDSGSSIS